MVSVREKPADKNVITNCLAPECQKERKGGGEVECQIEYTGEATGRASFLVAGKPLGLKASSLIGNRRGNDGCHGVEGA